VPSENSNRVIASDAFSQLLDSEVKTAMFAEGIGQCSFGPAVSKLSFFKASRIETRDGHPFETREITFEVVLPTGALFNWIFNFVPQLSAGIPDLEKASAQTMEMIKQVARFGPKS